MRFMVVVFFLIFFTSFLVRYMDLRRGGGADFSNPTQFSGAKVSKLQNPSCHP